MHPETVIYIPQVFSLNHNINVMFNTFWLYDIKPRHYYCGLAMCLSNTRYFRSTITISGIICCKSIIRFQLLQRYMITWYQCRLHKSTIICKLYYHSLNQVKAHMQFASPKDILFFFKCLYKHNCLVKHTLYEGPSRDASKKVWDKLVKNCERRSAGKE